MARWRIFIHTSQAFDRTKNQVFEIVVCRKLFEYEAYENYGLDAESGLLWQMMCFTGEQFTPEQLQASRLASVYFDETCMFAFSVIRLTSSPQI
jgi:hypothetical protein